MDSDVLELVSGMSIGDLSIQNATAAGYRQCEVSEESYPVLVADDSAKCNGLLIGGLTTLAIERVLFFEGEEYALKPIAVLGANEPDGRANVVAADAGGNNDAHCNAYYFSDNGTYTVRAESWDYADWQRHHKSSFVDASTSYMELFGQMTAAEADAHWLTLTHSPETSATNTTGLHNLTDKLAS